MNKSLKRIALIVAGGTGSRMGNNIPKQFLVLNGKPVLMHTIEKFHAVSDEVIVVLPQEWEMHWESLCKHYHFTHPITIVSGGSTRASSVKNGLALIHNESIVAVHDAARPLISQGLITKLYIEAEVHGNAIPVIPVTDSLRFLEGSVNKSVDRTAFRLVQTPQCFLKSQLEIAYNQRDFELYTDDASLLQAAGTAVHLVDGEVSNIKLTHPADFMLAEYYLKSIE